MCIEIAYKIWTSNNFITSESTIIIERIVCHAPIENQFQNLRKFLRSPFRENIETIAALNSWPRFSHRQTTRRVYQKICRRRTDSEKNSLVKGIASLVDQNRYSSDVLLPCAASTQS